MYGKALRMAQLHANSTDKMCIVPMDHGVTLGPIKGLEDYKGTISRILNGNPDAIILHKGLLMRVAQDPVLARGRYIMHLSGSTTLGSDTNYKVMVASVEEAIRLGALGVSIQIDLQSSHVNEMMKDFAQVSKACTEWGMPLLVMMYLSREDRSNDGEQIVHAVRVAEELGADMVKISYPGTQEILQRITSCVSIPVLVAGGGCAGEYEKILNMISNSMNAGAGGVAIGRYVFQSKYPDLITDTIIKLITKQITLNESINRINL